MNLAIIGLTVVGIVEAAALWAVFRGLRRLDRVDSRLGQLSDALLMLTETAETGFRANAAELARVVERAGESSSAASGLVSRRIAGAAKKGRAVAEIAAQERVAEGEVNLRLHLAKSAASRRQKAGTAKEA
jgi:hypothetical protein